MKKEEANAPKVYDSTEEMMDAYELLAQEASSKVICQFSCLNLAIEMGTADINGKKKLGNLKMTQEELEGLEKSICCDFHRQRSSLHDKLRRADVISMYVDLMVYDLDSKREGVHHTDFEDCLDEFMQKEFFVDSDED